MLNSLKDVLITSIEKWGHTRWFQCLFIFYAIFLPLCFGAYIVYEHVNKENTQEIVSTVLDERAEAEQETHRNNFNLSKQYYGEAKKVLKSHLANTNADYIFYIEYHNGTENIMTGVQFVKFDITLEVVAQHKPIIPLDKFKDDIVARYDILTSEEFNNETNILCYSIEEVETIDRYLALQLEYVGCTNVAFINLTDGDCDNIIGTLMFVSTENHVFDRNNEVEIYKCRREIENIFKNKI